MVTNLSKRLSALGNTLGFKLPAAGIHCKTVVTLAAGRTDEEKAELAALMCHYIETARRHYDASGRGKKKAAGFTISQALLHGGEVEEVKAVTDGRRRGYTDIYRNVL